MRKALYIVGGIVVVLVLVLAIVLFRDWHAPELGQRVLDMAGEAAGVELSVQGFLLNLSRGIRLQQVEIGAETPGGDLAASLDDLIFEHRLWPLLRGEVVVDRVVLDTPVIEMVTSEAGEEAAEEGPEAGTAPDEPTPGEPGAEARAGDEVQTGGVPVPITVSEISIVDGRLSIRTEGNDTEDIAIRELEIQLRDLVVDPNAPSALLGFSGHGEIRAGEVQLGNLLARDAYGELAVAGGVFRINNFTLTADIGELVVDSLEVDLGRDPFTYALTAAAESVNLNVLLKSDEEALGSGRMELAAAGVGPEPANLAAEGSIQLDAGRLPHVPLIAKVDEILNTAIGETTYEATTVDFAMGSGRVGIDPFALVTDIIRLDAGGWVDLEGPMSLRVYVGVPKGNVNLGRDVPPEALDAAADERGWISIPADITGTLENPSIALDTGAILRAARDRAGQAVREAAEDRLAEELGGLLGRTKKKKKKKQQ